MSRADRDYVRPPLSATEPRQSGVTRRRVRFALTALVAALAALAVALGAALTGVGGSEGQDPRLRPAPPPPGRADGPADR